MFKYTLTLGTLLLCMITFSVRAQQDGQYTQYMYNTQVFNPGYVGTGDYTSISALHRQQWLGVEGAPQTSTITVNAPLKKGLGIGGTIIHDALGINTETHAVVDIAYRLRLNYKYTLSMGVKGGANFMTSDFSQLNVFQSNEYDSYNRMSQLVPTVGTGAYFYSDRMYVGISAPNVLQSSLKNEMGSLTQRDRIHANLIAGYVFKFNSIQLKPAVLIKYVNGAPMNWHLSANALFNERFVAGLAYQSNSSASVLLGMHLKKRAYIGYAYDINLSALRVFGTGSHEIFIRMNLGYVNGNLKSPRFF